MQNVFKASEEGDPSANTQNINGEMKKIEEDYSMYDKPVDDDENEDDLLESIPEEADAEDEDDKGDKTKKNRSKSPKEGDDDHQPNNESEDEEKIANYLENQDEESEEETDDLYKAFEENKTLVKLDDKIKLLKHRCEAGLGYSLYEKAYKLITNFSKSESKTSSSDKLRSKLIDLIGEDNIGFWVIFDNIIFLERKHKELKEKK